MELNENANLNLKITAVLKKFHAKPDGSEWTNEEIEAGLADDYLIEELHFEDGVIVDAWRKED